MIFNVNVGKLIDLSISVQQLLFCYFVKNKDVEGFRLYREQFGSFCTKETIDDLIGKNLLKIDSPGNYSFSSLNITDWFEEVFKSTVVEIPARTPSKGSESWIGEWYELFPKGVKSGGYLVRSGITGCIEKMDKFLKTHPKFDKNIIMNATRLYLHELKKVDYNYIQQAKFFIDKNKTSALEAYCETIVNMMSEGKSTEIDDSDKFTKSLND